MRVPRHPITRSSGGLNAGGGLCVVYWPRHLAVVLLLGAYIRHYYESSGCRTSAHTNEVACCRLERNMGGGGGRSITHQ